MAAEYPALRKTKRHGSLIEARGDRGSKRPRHCGSKRAAIAVRSARRSRFEAPAAVGGRAGRTGCAPPVRLARSLRPGRVGAVRADAEVLEQPRDHHEAREPDDHVDHVGDRPGAEDLLYEVELEETDQA